MHHLRLWFPVLRRIVAIVNGLIEILISLLGQHIQRITHQHLLLETYPILLLCLCIELHHSSDDSSAGRPAHHPNRVSWLFWIILWLWMSSSRRYRSERNIAVNLFLLLLLAVISQLLIRIRQSWLRLFECIQWRIHWVVFDWSHYLNFLTWFLEVASILLLFRVVASGTVVVALILLLWASAGLDLDVLLILILMLMLSYVAIIIWLKACLCGSFIHQLGLISCLLQLHFLHCFQFSYLTLGVLRPIRALFAVLRWWLWSTWCRIWRCSTIICEYTLDFLSLLIRKPSLIVMNPISLTHNFRIPGESLVHHRIRLPLLLSHILYLLARRLRLILDLDHLHTILVRPMFILPNPALVLVVHSFHICCRCLVFCGLIYMK